HGRGAIVRTDPSHVVRDALLTLLRVNPAALMDLLEIRKLLEVEIAGLASQRVRTEDLQAMRVELERMRAHLGSADGYIEADVQFHSHLAHGAGNRVLLRMIEPIGELLRASRQVSASRPGSARRALREHEAILRAVAAGNAPRAREAMRTHLQATERDLLAVRGRSAIRCGRSQSATGLLSRVTTSAGRAYFAGAARRTCVNTTTSLGLHCRAGTANSWPSARTSSTRSVRRFRSRKRRCANLRR